MNKLLLSISLIAIGVTSFLWYTWPQYQSTEEIRTKISDHDEALSQINEIQQIRDQLLSRFNQIPQSSQYIMDRILPRSLDKVRFFIDLDQIAVRSNLSVQDISFSSDSTPSNQGGIDAPAEPSDPYKSTRVTFSVSGPYTDVANFIRDLEKSARLIDVVELTASAVAQNGIRLGRSDQVGPPSGEDNTYTITGITYWMPDNDS